MPVAIVVSVDIDEAAVSVDIVVVSVVVVVSSFFFESQAVAKETIDNTNRADFAKPFMILCV